MDNKINVYDEQGNAHEVEVLDIFNVEGYDKDYILYTNEKEIDDENIEAYVSILKEDNDNYMLLTIEDDNEWNAVHQAINEEGDFDENVGWRILKNIKN